MKHLILSGADPRSSSLLGFTPSDLAAHQLHKPILFSLLEACKNSGGGGPVLWGKEHEERFVDELVVLAGRMTLDWRGYTPLKCLMAGGEFEDAFFHFLLLLGSRVDSKNAYFESVLHVAALYGNERGVKKLLENGAHVGCLTSTWTTPLHIASFKGHKRVLEILLAHGADVKAMTIANRTAIDTAIEEGHGDVVDILIRHIIATSPPPPDSLSFPFKTTTNSGWSDELMQLVEKDCHIYIPPANMAAIRNKPHIIGILDYLGIYIGKELKHVNHALLQNEEKNGKEYDYRHNPYLENTPECRVYIGGDSRNSTYPIVEAVECGHAEVVKELLQRGVYSDMSVYCGNLYSSSEHLLA